MRLPIVVKVTALDSKPKYVSPATIFPLAICPSWTKLYDFRNERAVGNIPIFFNETHALGVEKVQVENQETCIYS